jgi:hypothetical protein
VAAGVVAASIGEHWWGVAFLIIGTCFFGFRRKFDFVSALEEGGIPDPVSQHSRSDLSDLSDSHHSDYSHDSGGDSDGGSHSD